MRCEGVRFTRYSDPEELLTAIPGVVFRGLPLRASPFAASITSFDLGDIVFQTGECTPAVVMAGTDRATAAVQLPIEGLDTFILNGRAVRPGTVGVYGAGGAMERANSRPTRHAVLLMPVDVAAALLAPPSDSPLLRPGNQALLQAHPRAWQSAVDLARTAATTATADPHAFDTEEARRSLRASLLHAARALIVDPEDCEAPRILRASPARRRIILAADDYLRANPARPIYTEDLCRLLGVSPIRLAEAFRASFGISPHRFLKMRRLAMVRSALRSRDDGDGAAPLVKTVALLHGFWHLGQFAHDYRAMYGEAPSETLARARGLPMGGDAALDRAETLGDTR